MGTFSALWHLPLRTGWDSLLYRVVTRAASAVLNPNSKLHPRCMKRRVALRRNTVKNYLAARLFLPEENRPRFWGRTEINSAPGVPSMVRTRVEGRPSPRPRTRSLGAPPDPARCCSGRAAAAPRRAGRDSGAGRGRGRGRTPAQRSQPRFPEPGAATRERNILLPGRS